ncbi:hypothetical protein QLX08_003911 [Tetragonisca angustula]|uniref:Uncharacterized protein n=1 Tax=Tetragonisca angustula TaxID=166442 RepID=A0AAW1A7R3_9HYME
MGILLPLEKQEETGFACFLWRESIGESSTRGFFRDPRQLRRIKSRIVVRPSSLHKYKGDEDARNGTPEEHENAMKTGLEFEGESGEPPNLEFVVRKQREIGIFTEVRVVGERLDSGVRTRCYRRHD